MKRELTIILLIGIVIQSCTSNKYLKSENYLNKTSNIPFFEPSVIVYSVDNSSLKLISKLKSNYNDSLSLVLKKKIYSTINRNKRKYRINDEIILNNETIEAKVRKELADLIYQSMTKLSIKKIELTPTIDSILESKNQRYALGIRSLGFSYKKESFLKKTLTNTTSILTLGIVTPPPVKDQLSFYSIIMDSKTNRITYARSTIVDENSPTDLNVIKKQLDQLFEDNTYEK
ncbi:hypothetical protein [Tenacibaculum ovolyticum]|uniref:hypothetical protein n=1 Tax=Tenacibaculum ovolyticum TaxID=104270 RepID=UPI0003FDAE68|nr:hypothetical protein [Tenacibaculum ovolyticum]